MDAKGRLIRTLDGPGAQGVNRVAWNLQEDPRLGIVTDWQKTWRDPMLQGVRVLLGEYTVRLQALGESVDAKATVRLNPNAHVSTADMELNYAAVKRLERMSYEMDEWTNRIRHIDAQIDAMQQTVSDASIKQEGQQIQKRLTAIQDDIQPPWTDPEHLNLRTKVRELLVQVDGYSGKPTVPQEQYIGVFGDQWEGVMRRLNGVITGQLTELNKRLAADHVLYISPAPSVERPPRF